MRSVAVSIGSLPSPPVLVILEGLGHERGGFLSQGLVAAAQGRPGSPAEKARTRGFAEAVHIFGGGLPSGSRVCMLAWSWGLGLEGDHLSLSALRPLGL